MLVLLSPTQFISTRIMLKRFLPLALLPVGACTHHLAPIGITKSNYSKYILDGHATRTGARAYLEPGRTNGTDGLFIRIGVPSIGPRQEVLYLDYCKPTGNPKLAYKPSFMSYNYTVNKAVYGLNFDANLHGTLRQTPAGGYSGTFRGICPGSPTHKKSRVKVVFKNVLTTRPT
jgi:hypothetical protein